MEVIDLGTIELGELVRVTDPCYDLDVWCSGQIKVLPGTYVCTVGRKSMGEWGERNIWVKISRVGSKPVGEESTAPFEVGVDSGQAGFFDLEYYTANCKDDDFDNPKSWYRRVSNLTLEGENCGTIDGKGVVTESGYGDGGYFCETRRDKSGYIVEAKIVFVD